MRTKDPAIFDAIESYINDYHDQHGAAPSMQQIATKIGMAKSTIHSYLARMRADGRVEYAGTRSLLTRENMKSLGGCLKVPIVGAIACGTPILAEENIEQYVTLPRTSSSRSVPCRWSANAFSSTSQRPSWIFAPAQLLSKRRKNA